MRTVEEILNIMNGKPVKVERGVVDMLKSIFLTFDLCDHRKSGKRVRGTSEYQPNLSLWKLLI